MKRVAETESRVVRVPVVVQPVPVHHDLAIVLVQVRDVEVAVLVLYERMECHLCHRPLNTLRAESNLVS
jgi:hypothetical protein